MPGERLSMRKIREVLRLRHAHGLSQRAIGASLRLSTGAVNMCLSRARRAGLSWPIPSEFDDVELERLLYPPPPAVPAEQRPVPDWAVVHRELRRPNVTLALLWEEYRDGAGAEGGFGYSWFCCLYGEWVGRLKPTMRQVAHRRRASVRRLRRPHDGGDRWGDRRGTPRRDLRRRAGCLKLYLRGSDLDAVTAGLDCPARRHAGVLRRRTSTDRQRFCSREHNEERF